MTKKTLGELVNGTPESAPERGLGSEDGVEQTRKAASGNGKGPRRGQRSRGRHKSEKWRKPEQDPMFQREASKYDRPIASRELILDYLAKIGSPRTLEQISEDFTMDGEEREALRRRLRAMERDGQVLRNRRQAYGVAEKMDLIHGVVSVHPDGFGFVLPEDGGPDLFLSPKAMRMALHGDTVLARVTGIDRRGRREGSVARILERGQSKLVGRFFVEHDIHYVTPDDRRIPHEVMVAASDTMGASHGQIVTVEILQYPDEGPPPQQIVGRVVEVLGEHMAPGMEVEIAIRKYGLPHVWPDEVGAEAEALPEEVVEEDKEGREDLRPLPLVTIDGEDARDFDDAVYAEKKGKSFRLIVAIADVSHYVRPEAPLDGEGYVRGNSVYFPDRVIPMLPEKLSNGLCSLNPQVDRLALACEMSITHTGHIRRFRFFNAVIRSHRRLTYNQVAAALGEDAQAQEELGDLLPHIKNLHALYKVLLEARGQRGAIDFDTVETQIIYGENKRITDIRPRERNDAHRLIEECMLAANLCAAHFFQIQDRSILYRIHQAPPLDKVEEVKKFLGELGFSLPAADKIAARHYSKILELAKGRVDYPMIQTAILRSLSQAVYAPECDGHFGLAYDAYTHFTSPIRRYPDLLVHRGIKAMITGEDYPFEEENRLHEIGVHCSSTERRADDASRDAVNWLKCEFMLDKVGEEFATIVTGVTSFGLFVQLERIYIEGLVHVASLGDDYYHFEPDRFRLVGERTRRVFQIGDSVRVKLVQVNLDDSKLEFEMA